MAIFRPRIAMSYLEQEISRLTPLAKRASFWQFGLELRIAERMYRQLRQTHRIECCDIPRRAQSVDASRKRGE